jgi:uncharacterized membrane protein YgcG
MRRHAYWPLAPPVVTPAHIRRLMCKTTTVEARTAALLSQTPDTACVADGVQAHGRSDSLSHPIIAYYRVSIVSSYITACGLTFEPDVLPQVVLLGNVRREGDAHLLKAVAVKAAVRRSGGASGGGSSGGGGGSGRSGGAGGGAVSKASVAATPAVAPATARRRRWRRRRHDVALAWSQ